MKFFVVVGKKALYTYEWVGQKYEIQFIEGNSEFSYNPSNAKDYMNDYLEALANEKNLGTVAKLKFDILDSDDAYCNSTVISILQKEGYIEKCYSVDNALTDVIRKLSRDRKLLIDEYGINYDGLSYKLQQGKLVKNKFDLLAYTIHCEDVIDMMNRN